MKRASVGLLLCLLCLGPLSERAGGDLLEFVFSGTMDSWEDPGGLLGLRVTRAFSGGFTYDSAAADVDASPNVGRYPWPIPTVTCIVGTSTFGGTGSTGEIVVINDAAMSLDALAFSANEFASGGLELYLVAVNLVDHARAALTSDVFPVSAADVQGFPGGHFDVKFAGGYASGLVTSFTIVPEPMTFMLFGAGVVLACHRRRWRGGPATTRGASAWTAARRRSCWIPTASMS